MPEIDPLLHELAAGRHQAFEAVYDRFGGRLYRAARAMLGRTEDAEDAVQDVFAALVRSRAKLPYVINLTAYLFTALRHCVGRIAKRRSRQPLASNMMINAVARDMPRQDPRGAALERALHALPAEQREVVALKIDGALTFAEIAQVLSISSNTAASRYRYALEKLRAMLKE